jgi:myo-inositol-1(or 4)-monophosphatase
MPDLDQELVTALAAARAAGKVVRASYDTLTESDVSEKAVNDLVTTVDVDSQRIIVKAIRDAFPDDFIIAEENLAPEVNAGRDPEASRRWYIDPLDGTTNYIHAYPMFAVSIALEIDHTMMMGATYAPMWDDMYHAVRGGGAFLNDRPIHVSQVSAGNRTLLGTGFPFRARHYLDIYLKSFSYFFNNSRGVRRAGSATLDFALVAAGRLDGFWEMTLSPWDMAAGVVLVEEAGGRVSDFFGGSRYLETGHVVASNDRFHDWMVEKLGDIFDPDTDYTARG